jgi:phenylpyruvate tautomerase PptA (4-oxalocrotonate tautomerase family)
MPIVQIYSEPPQQPDIVPKLIDHVRDFGAKALKCDPNNVWVIFSEVKSGHALRDTQGNFTPIVMIKANHGRTITEKENFVRAIALAISEALLIPTEQIWIHYQEINHADIWHKDQWAI